MKVTVKTKKTYTMEIDEREAQWLLNVLRGWGPLGDREGNMKRAFVVALEDEGVG